MNKNCLLINFCFLLAFYFSYSQGSQSIWVKTSKESLLNKQIVLNRSSEPTKAEFYRLDLNQLKLILKNAPMRSENITSSVIIGIPNSDGLLESYRMMKTTVMHPDLGVKYPEIQTYIGQGINNPSHIINISITPKGFHAMTLNTPSGTQYIDPYTNVDGYMVYLKKGLIYNGSQKDCGVEASENIEKLIDETFERNVNDGVRRTYQLALGCSVQYTNFHGGTVSSALAAMVVSINRVSGIYDRDFSVVFELVPDNDNLISTNGNEIFGNSTAVINTATSTINGIIGSANYDIGHVYTTGAGGLAGFGVVCTSNKGRGITGISAPIGDPFDVDFVAHEIGHQFGASHTFNGNAGNCSGGNRSASSAYEPGSGTTIMAYAGICAGQNVQNNSDDYFHRRSIFQISEYIINGPGSTCPDEAPTGNSAPTAEAGASYVIPISTPYKLTGSSTDADGTEAHTYTWEQYDLGPSGVPSSSTVFGPMVRSFKGTTSTDRYVPNLPEVLSNGGNSTIWEKLASVTREHTFEFTVRDNDSRGGQTDSDNMTVTTVNTAGPFVVTSQSTAETWTEGSTQSITWDVAGTDLDPINSSNVNILLSTNGGITFPFILAANVPNDGLQAINVPSGTVTNSARIIVEGSDNIFYNVNSSLFSIEESTTFTLNLEDTQKLVCQPNDNVIFNFTYNPVNGFNETTSFSINGLPAGSNATFNPSSASSNATPVELIISNLQNVDAGTYTLSLIGTSPNEIDDVQLFLDVANNNLSASNLVLPLNNTLDFSLTGNLQWQEDSEAENYLVEIATDATFNNVIESADVETSIYNPLNLNSNTIYFWRVTATNSCASAPISDVFRFTTELISCENYTAEDTPISISSIGTPTETSIINVAANDAPISDINVKINIIHTWVSDLNISLISPNGTTVELSNANGDDADNYTDTIFDQEATNSIISASAPFTGRFIPEGDLSTIYGETPSGEWILRVEDEENQDGGAIVEFSIEICVEGTLSDNYLHFENFAIFPNPNRGDFSIKFNSRSSKLINIGVYDLRGREIFKKTYPNPVDFSEVISLQNAQSGMYLVSISDGEKTRIRKIIVE